MIKKIYYVTIAGQKILCEQLYNEITLMLSECQTFAFRMPDEKRRMYYNLADDLRELLLQLPNGSKETGQHIDIIREYYGWDTESTSDVNKVAEKLFFEVKRLMPVTQNHFEMAVQRTRSCEERAQKMIKEEERRICLAQSLDPVSSNHCAMISEILGRQNAKADNDSYPKNNMHEENKAAQFLCELYLESEFSEFISVGLLKTSVELDIVNESEISELLENEVDKRDYEWYMEDYLGSQEYDKTTIKIADIWKFSVDVVENMLGYHVDMP